MRPARARGTNHTRSATTPLSIAELYLNLSDRHFTPIEIRMRWPAVMDNRDKFREYYVRYPHLFNPDDVEPESAYDRQYWSGRSKVPTYPSSCAEKIRRYFSSAFGKAVLGLVLDHQGQSEIIAYRLRAVRPVKYEDPRLEIHGQWRVGFVVASAPVINATLNFDTGDLLDLEWPENKK